MTRENLQGLWAVDGAGRIGYITGSVEERGLFRYVGEALAGGNWYSACPHVLAPYEQKTLNRIRTRASA